VRILLKALLINPQPRIKDFLNIRESVGAAVAMQGNHAVNGRAEKRRSNFGVGAAKLDRAGIIARSLARSQRAIVLLDPCVKTFTECHNAVLNACPETGQRFGVYLIHNPPFRAFLFETHF
jgi:hypothetical protein